MWRFIWRTLVNVQSDGLHTEHNFKASANLEIYRSGLIHVSKCGDGGCRQKQPVPKKKVTNFPGI